MGYLLPLYWVHATNPSQKIAVTDSSPLNHWFGLIPGEPPDIIDQTKSVKLVYLSRRLGYARDYRVPAFIGPEMWLWFRKRNLEEIAH